jgi:hypothetical protein
MSEKTYKVETRQPVYREYQVSAKNPEDAEKRAMRDGVRVREWVGSEDVDYDDTEEIDLPEKGGE